jgi:ABC-2 type transport system permease protein
VAASLIAIIGVGLGSLIRHTAGATTTLTLIIVGDVTLGQLLPAGLRQYLPGTATQAAITVHRSAGLLTPDAAIAILGAYATITLAAALIPDGTPRRLNGFLTLAVERDGMRVQ